MTLGAPGQRFESSPLVDCETLAAHQFDPRWRIFDCRHRLEDPTAGERAYAVEHIRGAFFLHLDRDLSGPKTGKNGRHPLPDPRVLAGKLTACGVSDETQVVVYDDTSGMFAARLWWLLRWLGHDRVAVLDGGLQEWLRCGKTVTAEPSHSAPGSMTLQLRDATVDTAEVLAGIGSPSMVVVDARGADRFSGTNEPIDPVGGHIPGARNRFFQLNLDERGRFKQPEALRTEFQWLLDGTSPSAVVHQCGSGVTACHNLLAMEIAGLRGSRLYPGSWSEWVSDSARPVER